MSVMDSLPENTVRRLFKVVVRTVHLVGVAGVFGNTMIQAPDLVYPALTIISGLVLVVLEASAGTLWFVQLRGVALYVKLLLLLFIHQFPDAAIPLLIAVIVVSGFMSHAPSWIRYFSLQHGKVVHSNNDMQG